MNDLEINNLAERIAKGKPLNVLIRILTFVSALAGIMSMFFAFWKDYVLSSRIIFYNQFNEIQC